VFPAYFFQELLKFLAQLRPALMEVFTGQGRIIVRGASKMRVIVRSF
jgi:hypothetical protein